MHKLSNSPRLVFQSDFDGTITVEDISFLILDKYALGDWRAVLEEYKSGRITVGQFNTRAFRMVKEEKAALENYVLQHYRIRPGFARLVDYCRQKGIRFVVVSNGLDFYIRAILAHLNMEEIEVYSASSEFGNEHIETVYRSPEGSVLDDGFKETYSQFFMGQGYKIIYAGNGASDAPAASLAEHAYATDALVKRLDTLGVSYTGFTHLDEIVDSLKNTYGD